MEWILRDQRQEVKDEALRDMKMEEKAQRGNLQACYFSRMGRCLGHVRNKVKLEFIVLGFCLFCFVYSG